MHALIKFAVVLYATQVSGKSTYDYIHTWRLDAQTIAASCHEENKTKYIIKIKITASCNMQISGRTFIEY